MLNENNEKILKKLLVLCKSGYKLIGKEDFDGLNDTENSLLYLDEREYITIRYKTTDEYLIKVLPKGKEYFQVKDDTLLLHSVLLRKNAVYGLIGGLIGSFLAGAIADIIFAVWCIYAR